MLKGKVLGIDFGTKRIGIAISDENQKMAFGRESILNKSEDFIIKDLKRITTSENICEIVVGYPLNMEGKPTKITIKVDKFIDLLENEFDIPIIRHDERLTSKQSDAILTSLGISNDKKKIESDIIAASLILKNYLEYKGKKQGAK